ncbi:RNA polymerase sigma factor [Bacillus taeanensis]|uniref:RNA polymerase sigma factor n=1 Tax=Bacillus taeanensis TaxID=273032 RepID=A0A366Y4M8_9BACI|nr:RNA polymerase sigma factor [Bacillus taeanensis]RBW71344.1 RNA polymerase sigma factor [Bacillus taeanensis]
MSEEELIAMAKKGDADAFRALVEQYASVTERFAYQIGASPNDIEDIAQEVFIRIYRFLHQYNGTTFTTWLYKITLNVCRDSFKKKQSTQRKLFKLFKQPVEGYEAIEPEIIKDEEDRMLHTIIQKMDEKYRIPIVLFYFHEKKQEEIAEILNIPLSTVKTRISRGKAKLKQKIEKREGEQHDV